MGLTYDELKELMQYIEDNHLWKNMYEIHHGKEICPKMIKYISFDMDTRDCDIWHIKFRSISGGNESEKVFRTENGYNLKDEVYKWLKATHEN